MDMYIWLLRMLCFETYLWIPFEPLSSLDLFRVCLCFSCLSFSLFCYCYICVVINHQKGGDCKHLGPLGMFRWLMTTIIVTNEFVQLNESLSLIWSYVKKAPQFHYPKRRSRFSTLIWATGCWSNGPRRGGVGRGFAKVIRSGSRRGNLHYRVVH